MKAGHQPRQSSGPGSHAAVKTNPSALGMPPCGYLRYGDTTKMSILSVLRDTAVTWAAGEATPFATWRHWRHWVKPGSQAAVTIKEGVGRPVTAKISILSVLRETACALLTALSPSPDLDPHREVSVVPGVRQPVTFFVGILRTQTRPVALARWTIYPLRIPPIRIVRATKPRLPPPGFLCDRICADRRTGRGRSNSSPIKLYSDGASQCQQIALTAEPMVRRFAAGGRWIRTLGPPPRYGRGPLGKRKNGSPSAREIMEAAARPWDQWLKSPSAGWGEAGYNLPMPASSESRPCSLPLTNLL
jgi:hypothetical protein